MGDNVTSTTPKKKSPNKSSSPSSAASPKNSSPISCRNVEDNNQLSSNPLSSFCQTQIQIRFKATQAPTYLLVTLGILCLVCFIRIFQINEKILFNQITNEQEQQYQLSSRLSSFFVPRHNSNGASNDKRNDNDNNSTDIISTIQLHAQQQYITKAIEELEEEHNRLRKNGSKMTTGRRTT